MASSFSRTLYRKLLQATPTAKPSNLSYSFYSKTSSSSSSPSESSSDLDLPSDGSLSEPEVPESAAVTGPEPVPFSSSASDHTDEFRSLVDRPLENGLDVGIYKAILIGQVGQNPVEKKLKSGRIVTMFSVGTGGIRNNRRPLDNEDPKEYANRCSVQWHRVSIYPERLGHLAVKNLVPGSLLYVEGNLETKVFSDPITGIVRRIREVAVRRNGRLVFLGKVAGDHQSAQADMKRAGYY